ncbi:hypothetical protein UFOVP45_109 [uncultured Caudovirales phage]|uniref:Uncharacterized protein n=1 Tax=uncultured Caudovirales phage TaxID=2100421 RepID=A0A6J5KS98_9CAUD|nr:hypothetical protein UFOVP45_109 [uncultured Caudovirales phage]
MHPALKQSIKNNTHLVLYRWKSDPDRVMHDGKIAVLNNSQLDALHNSALKGDPEAIETDARLMHIVTSDMGFKLEDLYEEDNFTEFVLGWNN